MQTRRLEGRRRLVQIASAIANPASAPVLARMISNRRQAARSKSATSEGGARARSRSCNRRQAEQQRPVFASLWMNRPLPSTPPLPSVAPQPARSASSSRRADPERSQFPRLLDLQTNNSKREVDSRRKSSAPTTGTAAETATAVSESSDYEVVSENTELSTLENASAVAKGADAMVKMSLSRPTEIIDTSKLIEEGKVETEYYDAPEVFEEQDHAMVDDYEKGFEYARRLRALLNMQFKELDRGTVETNFLLVKAHEHPTQKMIDRWRNVDYGVSYNDQVRRQKLIDDFRANAVKKKTKKGEEEKPVYPELIRFTVRFRKDNSEKRWKDYLTFRQKEKKKSGSKGGPAPKPNDKYTFAFLDIWSFCVVVFAKPDATVRDIIDPVFARVGLERRADFTYTIGCFNNDKRAGKAKILGVPNMPEPLEMYQLASELYKTNCTEIYVNDNRCEMYGIFPDYYLRGMPKNPGDQVKQPTPKKKKDKKKDKKGKDKGKAATPGAPGAPGAPGNPGAPGAPNAAAAPAGGAANASNVNKSNVELCDRTTAATTNTMQTPAVPGPTKSNSVCAKAAPAAPASPGTSTERQAADAVRLLDETAAFEEAATGRLSQTQQKPRKLTISERSCSVR